MPLNTLRLNHQASSHPNDRIVFIKPLHRLATQKSDYDIADTFLRAIAAQCFPLMKRHWLSVTTLEEYEPNHEFVGRNFNNGECIQLVLRSRNGSWLPFNMVQMVMMHELAHNVHMNHGKGFWQQRNLFAEEMKELWRKGYTGEGFWGDGRTLGDMGTAMGNNVMASEELGSLPLCGGTYRTRKKKKKKRKVGGGKELTWKEKKERRIEKKFGKNGVSLGEDENARMMYEIGKGSVGGKPRVAQSKRGRDLRAAAALARFGTNQKELEDLKEESEGEVEEYEEVGDEAKDIDGKRLHDKDGRGMTRICEDEDVDDVQVKQEMAELEGLERYFPRLAHGSSQEDLGVKGKGKSRSRSSSDATTATMTDHESDETPGEHDTERAEPVEDAPKLQGEMSKTNGSSSILICSICSLEIDPLSVTCMACAHVLDVRKDPKHWRCKSEACQDTAYINSGDAGVCGLCGAGKTV